MCGEKPMKIKKKKTHKKQYGLNFYEILTCRVLKITKWDKKVIENKKFTTIKPDLWINFSVWRLIYWNSSQI